MTRKRKQRKTLRLKTTTIQRLDKVEGGVGFGAGFGFSLNRDRCGKTLPA